MACWIQEGVCTSCLPPSPPSLSPSFIPPLSSLPQQTNALAEATLKNSKDSLANEQKVFKGLKKGFDEVSSSVRCIAKYFKHWFTQVLAFLLCVLHRWSYPTSHGHITWLYHIGYMVMYQLIIFCKAMHTKWHKCCVLFKCLLCLLYGLHCVCVGCRAPLLPNILSSWYRCHDFDFMVYIVFAWVVERLCCQISYHRGTVVMTLTWVCLFCSTCQHVGL